MNISTDKERDDQYPAENLQTVHQVAPTKSSARQDAGE